MVEVILSPPPPLPPLVVQGEAREGIRFFLPLSSPPPHSHNILLLHCSAVLSNSPFFHRIPKSSFQPPTAMRSAAERIWGNQPPIQPMVSHIQTIHPIFRAVPPTYSSAARKPHISRPERTLFPAIRKQIFSAPNLTSILLYFCFFSFLLTVLVCPPFFNASPLLPPQPVPYKKRDPRAKGKKPLCA